MKVTVGFILICVTVEVICCSSTEKPTLAGSWDRNDRGLVMPLLQDVNEVRCFVTEASYRSVLITLPGYITMIL